MKILVLFFVLLNLFLNTLSAQSLFPEPDWKKNKLSDPDINNVVRLHALGEWDSIALYTQHKKPEVRFESFMILASAPVTVTKKVLVKYDLLDPVPYVTGAKIFFTGNSGRKEKIEELISFVAKSSKDHLEEVTADAIGKLADSSTIADLVLHKSGKLSGLVLSRLLLQAAIKGTLPPTGVEWIVKFGLKENGNIPAYSLFALNRQKKYRLDEYKSILMESVSLYEDRSEFTSLMQLLIKSTSLLPEEIKFLKEKCKKDESKTAFYLSLSKIEFAIAKPFALEGLHESNVNVALQASYIFYDRIKYEASEDIKQLAYSIENPFVRVSLLRAHLRAESTAPEAISLQIQYLADPKNQVLLIDEVSNYLVYEYANTEDAYYRAACIAALCEWPCNYKYLAGKLSEKPDVISTAAIEALSAISNNPGFVTISDSLTGIMSEMYGIMRKAIESGNGSLAATATGLFLDSNSFYYRMTDNWGFLKNAVNKLNPSLDLEAVLEIMKLAESHNLKLDVKGLPEYYLPPTVLEAEKLKTYESILITTTEGNLKFKLDYNRAPLSVCYITQLFKKDFYKNKYFHRVVPNFVIQAGCPRGDGYGNTGYLLRSEFSGWSYKTNAIGIASAGIDTESCQWFVTTSNAFHLDGRYTQIGEMIEGESLAKKITVGCKILQTTVMVE